MTRPVKVALALMRMALALLDQNGEEDLAACRLQHAIDSLGVERGVCQAPSDAV